MVAASLMTWVSRFTLPYALKGRNRPSSEHAPVGSQQVLAPLVASMSHLWETLVPGTFLSLMQCHSLPELSTCQCLLWRADRAQRIKGQKGGKF